MFEGGTLFSSLNPGGLLNIVLLPHILKRMAGGSIGRKQEGNDGHMLRFLKLRKVPEA